MKDRDIQAINNLNDLLSNLRDYSGQQIKNNVQILVQGINELDQEVKQKTFEVQNREQLLAQRDNLLVQKDNVINLKDVELLNRDNLLDCKDQTLGQLREDIVEKLKAELIDTLPKLYPNMYPPEYENWPNDWGRTVIDRKDITSIEEYLPNFKMQLLKNELIDILPKLFPSYYPVEFQDWPNDWGRTVIENNDFKEIKKYLPNFRQQLIEKLNQSVLIEKKAKEEETAKLKELLSIKEVETQNKDQLLFAKELEKQELARLKEIEKKELLAQKEAELQDKLHDKSLVKNQVIGELHGALNSQEKEAYKLQIESLMKELEFNKKALEFKDKEVELHKKEVELKDKALEDARIISELKGQLLTLKALYGHDVSFSEEFSAIQFRAENSIENKDFDDIADLSRYISRLVEAEKENSVSLDISELLSNISPISPINSAQHPVAVVNNGNFDIDQMHVTHSVLLSGSVEISILEDESI